MKKIQRNLIKNEVNKFIRILSEDNQIDHTNFEYLKPHSWENSFVEPHPDESLFSWLYRQAAYYDLSIYELLKSEVVYWREYGYFQDLKDFNQIYRLMRRCDIASLGFDFASTFTLRGFPNFKDYFNYGFPDWFYNWEYSYQLDVIELFQYNNILFRSKLPFCPICWQNEKNRYFRMSWRLTLQSICITHNTKLHFDCQNCYKYHFKSDRIIRNVKSWLENCQECGFLLSDSVVEKVTEDIVEIQSLVYYNIRTLDWYLRFLDNSKFGILPSPSRERFFEISNISDRTLWLGFELELYLRYRKNKSI